MLYKSLIIFSLIVKCNLRIKPSLNILGEQILTQIGNVLWEVLFVCLLLSRPCILKKIQVGCQLYPHCLHFYIKCRSARFLRYNSYKLLLCYICMHCLVVNSSVFLHMFLYISGVYCYPPQLVLSFSDVVSVIEYTYTRARKTWDRPVYL